MSDDIGNVKVVGVSEEELSLWIERCISAVGDEHKEWALGMAAIAGVPRLIDEVRRLQGGYDRVESILSGLTYHITDGKLSKIYDLETLKTQYDDAHMKSVDEVVEERVAEMRGALNAATARAEKAEGSTRALAEYIVVDLGGNGCCECPLKDMSECPLVARAFEGYPKDAECIHALIGWALVRVSALEGGAS